MKEAQREAGIPFLVVLVLHRRVLSRSPCLMLSTAWRFSSLATSERISSKAVLLDLGSSFVPWTGRLPSWRIREMVSLAIPSGIPERTDSAICRIFSCCSSVNPNPGLWRKSIWVRSSRT